MNSKAIKGSKGKSPELYTYISFSLQRKVPNFAMDVFQQSLSSYIIGIKRLLKRAEYKAPRVRHLPHKREVWSTCVLHPHKIWAGMVAHHLGVLAVETEDPRESWLH